MDVTEMPHLVNAYIMTFTRFILTNDKYQLHLQQQTFHFPLDTNKARTANEIYVRKKCQVSTDWKYKNGAVTIAVAA
jgi:hypothetical protein